MGMAALPDRFNAGKRQFWCEFLKMYQDMPELWNVQHTDYRNKELRNESYEVLQRKLMEIEPNATKSDVGRRINIFRTNYRREQMRIWKQQELGLHPNLCKPTLWFFENMNFLMTQESFQHRAKRARIWPKAEDRPTHNNNKNDSIMDPLDTSLTVFPHAPATNNNNRETTPTVFLPAATNNNRDTLPAEFDESMLLSPKIEIFDSEPCLETNIQAHNEYIKMDSNATTPEFPETAGSNSLTMGEVKSLKTDSTSPFISETSDALAKSWAIQYEEMEPMQRILARKAIADILFEGCMGNLRINRGERTSVGNHIV